MRSLFNRLCSFFLVLILVSSCNNTATDNTNEKHITDTVPDIKTLDASIVENSSNKEDNVKKSRFVQAYDSALMLFQVAFTEQDIETTYGKAHIITCGKSNGEPIVLLHGMNATSTMWYPNIKALAAHYRIYAIDFLLEPGKSVSNNAVDDTKEVLSWYFQIFDKLKLDKFNLVGASRGGWLAMNIALAQPNRVKKMALLSPAQTFVWIKPLPDVIKNIAYTISPKRKNLRSVLETMTENVDNISQVYLNQYYIATQDAEINKCFIQMRPFSKEELKSLNMPILLLIGDNDIINNDKALAEAKKYLSQVKAKKITKAGHFLSMDQADVVNGELINFMNQK